MTTHLWKIKIGGFIPFEKSKIKFIIPSVENINFISNLLNLDLSKIDSICAVHNYSKINLEIRSNKKIISEIEFDDSNDESDVFYELISFCNKCHFVTNYINESNDNPTLTIICACYDI